MWISRKDFIVLPYLCSLEYMVERRAYHLSQKKTHQKIARFRSVSVKKEGETLNWRFGSAKTPIQSYQLEENIISIGHHVLSGSPPNFQNPDCVETGRFPSRTITLLKIEKNPIFVQFLFLCSRNFWHQIVSRDLI